jgi:soluble lytic murein transglycosylase-like protein
VAGATVIDQLIVKLGLDPSGVTKGSKQAAAEFLKTEQTVKRGADNMGRSIVGFTGKLLGVVTVASAVKKGLSFVSDLSRDVRQLGIDSKNFGIAANELRNFQNVSEMFGGKAEDATKTIGNLTKAVYDLAYNGQISDSLVMLGRLGVRFQDTSGKARNFNDIVLDTEKRVQQLAASGHSRENLNQMLAQAGFDPGLSQAILAGRVGEELNRQRTRRQVSGEVVGAATEWERSATNRDQAIAAATLRVLPAQAAAGTKANDLIAGAAEGASDLTLQGGLEALTSALETSATAIKDSAGKVSDALDDVGEKMLRSIYPKGRQNYERDITDAARKYGIDPEMLAGVLATESNFDPAAVSPAGAVGIAQLMPKYFPGAGKNPHEDIDTAAAYLKTLRDAFLKDGMSEDDAYYRAFQSYNAGQSRVRKAMAGGKPLAQETIDYPGKVLGYAAQATPSPGAQTGGSSGTSTSNSVSIGKIEVQTQATDADGIMRDAAGAAKRKFMAAQADNGVS